MLEGASANKVKLAFARAIIATFDKGRWLELGLITDTEDTIRDHPRLLRALSFGDEDYSGAVYDVLPTVLGEERSYGQKRFRHLQLAEQYVRLGEWLATNDYDLYEELYGEGTALQSASTLELEDSETPTDEVIAVDVPHSTRQNASDEVSTVDAQAIPIMAAEVPSDVENGAHSGTGIVDVPRRSVFLVHGRDLRLRDSMVALLRAFDLRVVDWDEASRATGVATPYTGDVIVAGMNVADVVVVLLTPDDLGCVHPKFLTTSDGLHESRLNGQPRMNVIFEAGIAMARDRTRVVIVEIGDVRAMSDTEGLNVLRIKDDLTSRRRLGGRLKTAGLAVHMDNDEWPEAGDFAPDTDQPVDAGSIGLPVSAADKAEDVKAGPAPTDQELDPVAALKVYLPDPQKRILLEELLESQVDVTLQRIQDLPVPQHVDIPGYQDLLSQLTKISEPAIELLVAGVRFDRGHEYVGLWQDYIQRLMQARKLPKSGPFAPQWEAARHVPALLALRAAGIVAVHYEYDEVLIAMLKGASWREWTGARVVQPAAVALNDFKVLEPQMIKQFPMWGDTRYLYPASHYLRETLRDLLRKAIPDDEDYRRATDGFEFRCALIQWTYASSAGSYRSAPGEFLVSSNWNGSVLVPEQEFRRIVGTGEDSPWIAVTAPVMLEAALDQLRDELIHIRSLG